MNPEQIRQLWNLLLQSWGQKFAEQYGAEPNDAWTAMLASTEPSAAGAAFKALVLSGSPFPPTLPEFLAEARKHVRRQAVVDMNALRPPPQDPVSPERARENIERLRRTLNS
jgi:hypothetical protein